MNVILFSEKDKRDDCFIFKKKDERYSHITKVLKLKAGDSFKAGIINAELGMAYIKELREEEIIFEFLPNTKPAPLHPLHLILGIPRPIQLKRLLKDVSTMGVSSIHLVGTLLGEKSYITSSLIANDEIEKHLIEGAAQAGSTLIPSHHIYSTLSHALQQNNILSTNKAQPSNVIRLLFDVEDEKLKSCNQCENFLTSALENLFHNKVNGKEDCEKKTKSLLAPFFVNDKQIVLAIGSERGWVRSERELFYKHNYTTITLGERIMRCETATIAAISYVLSRIGWNA